MIYLVWSAVSTKRHLAGIFELRVVCLSANPSVCRKTCQYRAYLALLSNRLRTNVVERKKLAVKKYPRICSQRPRNIERWNLLNISQILSFHIISLLQQNNINSAGMSVSLVRCPECELTTTSCILLLSHLAQVHSVSFLCYLCLHTFENIRQLVWSMLGQGRNKKTVVWTLKIGAEKHF